MLAKRATTTSLLKALYRLFGKEQGCGGNLIRLGTFVFGVR